MKMKFLLFLSAIGLSWAQYDPQTQQGRTSIVHLFEWRWVDIAKECERYLAPNGYGGVQVILLSWYKLKKFTVLMENAT
jgi:alpha-amylase